MNAKATTLFALLSTMVLGTAAFAQPVRNGTDVVWARDVAGASMTLDGVLDETAWSSAETIDFVWGNPPGGLPGSGQKVDGTFTPTDPPDPTNATLYLLRDGNTLWLGLEADDRSIGGGTGLWSFDGLLMSIVDRSQRPDDFSDVTTYSANGAINSEWALTWWNPADTTDSDDTYDDGSTIGTGQTIPGSALRGFGDYGVGFGQGLDGENRTAEDVEIWDWAATVLGSGITNDDTHGDDEGYVIETRIDLAALGYDMTQPGGDQVPLNIALNDDDYSWPNDADRSFLTRVWWQNQWLNNFNEGVGFVYGDPSVTINSGPAPDVTEPEFRIPSLLALTEPTIDGSLTDVAWTLSEPTFQLKYQMSPEELDDWLPGTLAPYHVSYWRPDINGDGRAAEVVDPSTARIHMAFEDNMLYVGVDVDDQAINGVAGEDGRDGIRFAFRALDSLDTDGTLSYYLLDFSIDSTGALRFERAAGDFEDEDPDIISAGVALKGSSTVADPSDVDEGYTMEFAFDLEKMLGYPSDGSERRLWLALNFFDGDFLDVQANSYATRTWMLNERTAGAASLYGYLDPTFGVAVEGDPAALPERITLHGNYPNPFNPSTTLRYDLPETGRVTVEIFDVLGRQVLSLSPGVQQAGLNALAVDAAALSSGVYFYRIAIAGAKAAQTSAVGRMTLLR